MANLNGKNAVVTGAGGVLCSKFAEAIALNGGNVAVVDLNIERATEIADEINAKNKGKAIAVQANVLDKASLEAAYEKIHAELGNIDILINGAGGNNPKGTTSEEYYHEGDIDRTDIQTFFNLDESGVRFVFDLNFLGTLMPTQVFAKDMVRAKDGVILNVSSMNAFCPLTKIPAYSGAKAAVSNFTQWLAVHFAQSGIRVNAVAPGFFVTAQNEKLLLNPDGSLTPRSNKIISGTPMGRFGKPEELIGTVLYLLDNEASGFVTGVVIPVDGGFAAYSGV